MKTCVETYCCKKISRIKCNAYSYILQLICFHTALMVFSFAPGVFESLSKIFGTDTILKVLVTLLSNKFISLNRFSRANKSIFHCITSAHHSIFARNKYRDEVFKRVDSMLVLVLVAEFKDGY